MKLLFDEPPLVVSPTLAKLIGLNEAIIIQQLHYWLSRSQNIKEGRKWVYNSISGWKEQFPFWSENTIRRTLKKLEEDQLIITSNFNKKGFDRTKWYSINYEKLEELTKGNKTSQNGQIEVTKMGKSNLPKWVNRTYQNEQMELTKMGKPIPETTTETTTETTKLAEKSAGLNIPSSKPSSKQKKKTLSREEAAAENPKTVFAEERLKELKKALAKMYVYKYQNMTGLKYPSADYGKLMKLSEKAAEYFLKQLDEGMIPDYKNLIYRAWVLINFTFARKKTDPAIIYGKVAESYAEMKTYQQDSREFYKKIFLEAKEEADKSINEIFKLVENFINDV